MKKCDEVTVVQFRLIDHTASTRYLWDQLEQEVTQRDFQNLLIYN